MDMAGTWGWIVPVERTFAHMTVCPALIKLQRVRCRNAALSSQTGYELVQHEMCSAGCCHTFLVWRNHKLRFKYACPRSTLLVHLSIRQVQQLFNLIAGEQR